MRGLCPEAVALGSGRFVLGLVAIAIAIAIVVVSELVLIHKWMRLGPRNNTGDVGIDSIRADIFVSASVTSVGAACRLILALSLTLPFSLSLRKT